MQNDDIAASPDLRFLIANKEENGTYLLGNDQRFVQVPEIGVQVVSMMDGTRSISEVHDLALESLGADIDISIIPRDA